MSSSETCSQTITAYLAKLLARAFGLDLKTIEAWRRPKASDANPFGSGKANPLDQVERAIRIIYPFDPGGARLWVGYLYGLLERLDTEHAAEGFSSLQERCNQVAGLVKEHADAIQVLIAGRDDAAALRELEEMIAVGGQLAACLRAEIGAEVH